ncbi:MAG: homocysteine S-methyltransferase family protein [Acidobacteriota bacterium]
MNHILSYLKNHILLLDGAMGTELIKRGLSGGKPPELWNIENKEEVKKVHKTYLNAGSDAILTNTFGANRIKLASFNLDKRTIEINRNASKLTKEVIAKGKFIGGDIGPTGKLLKPYGEYSEEELIEVFGEQASVFEEEKLDFIILETFYDLKEALCALKASRSNSNLPVFVSMTFTRAPKGYFTIMGNSIEQTVKTLQDNGADAIGTNCSLPPSDIASIIKEIQKYTDLPIIAEPNAGNPYLDENGITKYEQNKYEYAKDFKEIILNRANIVGGCCGTDPEYIKEIKKLIKN